MINLIKYNNLITAIFIVAVKEGIHPLAGSVEVILIKLNTGNYTLKAVHKTVSGFQSVRLKAYLLHEVHLFPLT